LAFLDFGVSAMVWGFLASVAAKALLLCKVGWQDWKPRFHFSGHDLKGYMSFGLYEMGERGIT
jgi:PST family polysaccharide transporter/lipopolysaccharide exporter